jgi:uncharacterized protein
LVLRDDFHPYSDVDFLYVLMPEASWEIFDLINAEEELAKIVGRKVDLVSKKVIQQGHNWLRRKNILSTARKIYVKQ